MHNFSRNMAIRQPKASSSRVQARASKSQKVSPASRPKPRKHAQPTSSITIARRSASQAAINLQKHSASSTASSPATAPYTISPQVSLSAAAASLALVTSKKKKTAPLPDSASPTTRKRQNLNLNDASGSAMSALFSSMASFLTASQALGSASTSMDANVATSRLRRKRRVARHFAATSLSTFGANVEMMSELNSHIKIDFDNVDFADHASSSSRRKRRQKQKHLHDDIDNADYIDMVHADRQRRKAFKNRTKRTTSLENENASSSLLAGTVGMIGALGGIGQATFSLFSLFNFGTLSDGTESVAIVDVNGENQEVTDDG